MHSIVNRSVFGSSLVFPRPAFVVVLFAEAFSLLVVVFVVYGALVVGLVSMVVRCSVVGGLGVTGDFCTCLCLALVAVFVKGDWSFSVRGRVGLS